MSHDRTRRIRAFVMVANDTMRDIPLPVPPRPPKDWDGATLETGPMHRTYNLLPNDVQELAAQTYTLCLQALDQQREAMKAAVVARHHLIKGVAEHPEWMDSVRDLYGATSRPDPVGPVNGTHTRERDDEPDEVDAALLEAMEYYIEDRARAAHAEGRDAAAETGSEAADQGGVSSAGPARSVTAVEPPAPAARHRLVRAWAVGATAVATIAIAASILMWQRADTARPGPAPVAAVVHPIHRSVQVGDMAMVLSVAESTEDFTDVHVHMVNTGSSPESLSFGTDDLDASGAPTVVPARSIQHRVVRVPKRSDGSRHATVEIGNRTMEQFRIEIP